MWHNLASTTLTIILGLFLTSSCANEQDGAVLKFSIDPANNAQKILNKPGDWVADLIVEGAEFITQDGTVKSIPFPTGQTTMSASITNATTTTVKIKMRLLYEPQALTKEQQDIGVAPIPILGDELYEAEADVTLNGAEVPVSLALQKADPNNLRALFINTIIENANNAADTQSFSGAEVVVIDEETGREYPPALATKLSNNGYRQIF